MTKDSSPRNIAPQDFFATGGVWRSLDLRWEVGQVLKDRYRLLEQINRGGMADIWKAFDQEAERIVAIKRLGEELLREEAAQQRFLREIQTLSQLDHPDIVRLYDLSPEGMFFVMEYLEGKDLRHLLNEQRSLPLHDALEIFAKMADVLVFTHQKGLIHRDLKPENVFLHPPYPWGVKLLDFGIVYTMEGTRYTATLSRLGTAYYMAPEQLHPGPSITEKADVYSCGQMLYEALSGRVVQAKAPPLDKVFRQRIEQGQLPPSVLPEALRPVAMEILTELQTWIDRALEYEPEERCTMSELADALKAFHQRYTEARQNQAGTHKAAILRTLASNEKAAPLREHLEEVCAMYPESTLLRDLSMQLQEGIQASDALAVQLQHAEPPLDLEDRRQRWKDAAEQAHHPAIFSNHAYARGIEAAYAALMEALKENKRLIEQRGPLHAREIWQTHQTHAKTWRAHDAYLQSLLAQMQSVPTLIRKLADIENTELSPEQREQSYQIAQTALRALGRSVLPTLIDALSTEDPALRSGLLPCLASWGEDSRPLLREALQSPQAPLRQGAASALGQHPSIQSDDFKALGKLLGDPEEPVRIAAAEALAAPHQKAGFDELLDRIDPNQPERSMAVLHGLRCYAMNDPQSLSSYLSKIASLLEPDHRTLREAALQTLLSAGEAGATFLLACEEAFLSLFWEQRYQAALAFARYAKRHWTKLLKTSDTDNWCTQEARLFALIEYFVEHPPAPHKIYPLDTNEIVAFDKAASIAALLSLPTQNRDIVAALGNFDRDVMLSLIHRLQQNFPIEIRRMAAQALAQIGPLAWEAAEPLSQIVAKPDDSVDLLVDTLKALAAMQTAAFDALPHVRTLLQHPHAEVCDAAVKAITAIHHPSRSMDRAIMFFVDPKKKALFSYLCSIARVNISRDFTEEIWQNVGLSTKQRIKALFSLSKKSRTKESIYPRQHFYLGWLNLDRSANALDAVLFHAGPLRTETVSFLAELKPSDALYAPLMQALSALDEDATMLLLGKIEKAGDRERMKEMIQKARRWRGE